jgi:hypothetical protein
MKRSLTLMSELITIELAGKTEAGSVEVQPARDNQFKAANYRWGGSKKTAIPFYQREIFVGLLCLKKPDKNSLPKAVSSFAESSKSLLTTKWICPIHAEPIHHNKAIILRNR